MSKVLRTTFPRDSSNKTDSSSSVNEAPRSKGHEGFYNWISEEDWAQGLWACVKIRARVSRRAKQASRSKTGSNGLEQKHKLKVTISVNPKDERVALKGVFTQEAGKKTVPKDQGKAVQEFVCR